MGQREQILEHVCSHPGQCDDCIADQLGIEPRQTVNAHRRALQGKGLIDAVGAVCVRCSRNKITSKPASAAGTMRASLPTRRRAAVIQDGSAALEQIIARAGYASVAHVVAEHTVFLHPDTVAQTRGEPVFPVIRAKLNTPRRRVVEVDGRRLWADDNGPPTYAFLWAARRRKGPDIQFNHVWPGSDVPELYTALWNLCVTPAFLAKTTDTHPEVRQCLRYRAFALFDRVPAGEKPLAEPQGYASLQWAPHPEPIPDLEAVFRAAMASASKNSATTAARELGWLFSGWRPDATL